MAEERLGASFSIDVSQLQAGLRTANKLIRESQSEFKAAAAGMDDWRKSEEGLNARNQALTQQMQLQQSKVAALKQNYQQLVANGLDPASDRAIQLRTQINNEEAALRRNEAEVKKNTAALENLGDESVEAGNDATKAGDGFTILKGVLANLATQGINMALNGLKNLGAAAINLGKQAIESYADYEQLVGGVETLFGAGGQSLEEYAQSVGKSVNDAKGEYDKLMNAQNTMITNANNAYKTAGMSANEYMENVTGFSASLISSLGGDTEKAAAAADRAMQDISDNSNKMGTDMQSIVDTYQSLARGNYQMLDNLKLGYGGTKTEMERMIADANKVKAANGEMANLSIDSFADITEAIHIIQDEMGITGTTAKEAESTISGSIGMMKSSWQNLLTGMADDTMDFDQLITNFIDSIEAVAKNLIPRITIVMQGIIKLIQGLLPQIPPLLQELLPQLVVGIKDLANGIADILPDVIDTLVNDVLPSLLTTLIELLPTILTTLVSMVTSIIDGLTAMLPTIIDAVIKVVPLLITALVNSLPKLLNAAITLLMAIVQAVPKILPKLQAMLPQIIKTLTTFFVQNLGTILNAAVMLFTEIVKAIPVIIPVLVKQIPTIISSIYNALTSPEAISSIASAGEDLIRGLWNGINDMASWIGEKIKGFGSGVLNSLKNFFGIKSPSKVMEEQVGKNIARGIVKGIDGQKKNAKKSAKELSELYVKAAKDKANLMLKQNKMTYAQEVDFWREILSHTKKKTKSYKTASLELAKAKENATKYIVKDTKTNIDIMKKRNAITVSDEIAMWKKILAKTKKGTSSYKAAQKELASAQQDYRKKSLKYEQDYAKGVQKIENQLAKDIQAAVNAYDEAVSSRKDAITGQFDLFEGFKSSTKKTSTGLIKNMQSQVDALNRWDAALDKLSKRKGVTKAMVAELQELGIDETANIELIANMSDKELKKYVSLWKKRNNIANDRAIQENADLATSTRKRIKTLVNNANTDLNKLEKTYMTNMGTLQKKTKDKSKTIGQNIVKGLKTGIHSQNKDFQKYLTNFFKSITSNAKKALKIHSPSKVMKDVIGKNIALGIVEGFDENIKGLNASINAIGNVNGSVGSGMQTNGGINNSRSVVVNQYNTYSQAHSRYEIYKSKQQTAAAVRLALGKV